MIAQVLSRAFELLGVLAKESSSLGKKEAFQAMNGIVEKMSDIKLKGPGGETLLLLAEAVGPQFVLLQLHKKAAAAKNPKVGDTLQHFQCSCWLQCEWQKLVPFSPQE